MANTSGKTQQTWDTVKTEFGSFQNRMQRFNKSIGTSSLGKSAYRGLGMSLGWDYTKEGVSTGFLGWKEANFGKTLASRASALGGMAMKGIPLAFTLYGIGEGYHQEGIWGAIKGGAENIGMNMAWEMVGGSMGAAIVPMAMIAAGYAGYKYVDTARDYGKGLRRVNMGAPIVDMFGTVATTRQRSLQALQNTHINGRMALGNEGMLIHNNIYGRR